MDHLKTQPAHDCGWFFGSHIRRQLSISRYTRRPVYTGIAIFTPTIDLEGSLSVLSGTHRGSFDLTNMKMGVIPATNKSFNAKLERTKITVLQNTDFRKTILLLTNFEGANCRQAKFNDARATLAKFNDALLIHADFSGALLQGVQFKHADLKGAIFENAILKHCDFSGADVTGVYFTPEQQNSLRKV
jgi:uncharacterized protein YjbI with pentapeptide repeats